MAIDASIAMGVKPMRMDNPMDSYGKALSLQQLMGQAQDTQQARQDKLTLSDLYRTAVSPDGKLDRNALFTGAAQRGMGAQIPGMQKTFNEQDKAQREAEKAQIEQHLKRFELSGQIMNGVTDQTSYDRAREMAAQVLGPEVAAKMPPEYNPALIAENQAKAIDVKTQLEQKWKAMEYSTPNANAVLSAKTSTDNNAASNATSRANNAASVGASYANAGATREIAKATRDAANIQRDQTTEMKLGDDWRAQSKDFKAVGDAYKQISATLDKSTTSPAATLAAATKFMKLLDPGSVVRESELGMALAATGVFDRATNYVNTLKYGKVLTANQAADFKNITAQIYGAAQSGQQQVDAAYTKQANAYKLRPEMVVQDLGQNAPAVKPAPGKVVNFGDLK
jgi:hypothetical protein